MSEALTESEPTATQTGRKSGGYVILKEITDVAQLAELIDSQGTDGAAVYAVYRPMVEARDGAQAIRAATVGDHDVDEGVYIAVPKGSFKPREVRATVQVTLV